MKKTIAIIFTLLSLLIILDSVNFGHALMMFLLAGVIPGTNITMNGEQMLEFTVLVAGFIFARITTYVFRNLLSRNVKSTQIHA